MTIPLHKKLHMYSSITILAVTTEYFDKIHNNGNSEKMLSFFGVTVVMYNGTIASCNSV